MEIVLLTIGKTANREISALTEKYVGRLRHYIPFRIDNLPDVKRGKANPPERQKILEGELLLGKIEASDHLCLLDERGTELTSGEFANLLQKRMTSGLRRLIFAIGGPYGFSETVYLRADSKLSLSRMTFNHEMVRLFFTEQIYRGMTILRGEPYHHD